MAAYANIIATHGSKTAQDYAIFNVNDSIIDVIGCLMGIGLCLGVYMDG